MTAAGLARLHAALLSVLLAASSAGADGARIRKLRACDRLRGAAYQDCLRAATTVHACDPCEVALPRLTIRLRGDADHPRLGQRFEVVVENVTGRTIAFAAFDGRYPMFDVEWRNGDDWAPVRAAYCGNAFDGMTSGRLAPGKRAVFPLDPIAEQQRPFRVGLEFWFRDGASYTAWSEPRF